MSERDLAAVIMAAGKGTRMNDPTLAKVMFPVGGVPMIDHVIDRALECRADPVIVIIGYQRQAVQEHLDGVFGDRVKVAVQSEQLGTGHAVMQASPLLTGFAGDVLILSGDVPLITAATIRTLVRAHRSENPAATVLTVTLADPTGYGRIVRDSDGLVSRIVEQKDASEEQRRITEINSGIYVFNAGKLLESLRHLTNHNAQGEYYLTDVFGWLRETGGELRACCIDDHREVQGINTVEQLAEVDRHLAAASHTKP